MRRYGNHMSTPFRLSLTLAVAAGCLAALTSSSLVANSTPARNDLDALFALYDREPDGPAKDQLAAEIDAAAHQKYATVSRLRWHTDLASAQAAARVEGRPILHLRMLGRLDEDLSCANSRLFRTTLYANQEVSAFLRERFVLYWSSERAVPRVTIDYGDGRMLERTTTGNSAHYVLNDRGDVLDVLPGLYAPKAFRQELERSLALAARVRGASDKERAKVLVDYHQQRVTAARNEWERLSPTRIPVRQLTAQPRVQGDLAAAQLRTMSKAMIELKDLKVFAKGLAPEAVSEDEIETWSSVGRALYGLGATSVLDQPSRALIVRMHNAVPGELRATDQERDQMIARLEQTLAADTALNQLRLRPQIGRQIVRLHGRTDFATLNAWIYAEVFRTPKQDAWLGLLPRNVFTGLPGDGVVMRR
jgi:hypothetical protein